MKRILLITTAIIFLFVGVVFATSNSVTKTISSSPGASGTYTNALSSTYKNKSGFMNISVYGATWAGIVTLERKFSGGSTWFPVKTWTLNAQKAFYDTEPGVKYRIGIANGDYSSGSVAVRLSN